MIDLHSRTTERERSIECPAVTYAELEAQKLQMGSDGVHSELVRRLGPWY